MSMSMPGPSNAQTARGAFFSVGRSRRRCGVPLSFSFDRLVIEYAHWEPSVNCFLSIMNTGFFTAHVKLDMDLSDPVLTPSRPPLRWALALAPLPLRGCLARPLSGAARGPK
jgi:hypothetical protein